jgi:hypothetical protein
MNTRSLLEAVIGIVIGVTLFPVVQDTVDAVNATGTTATLLDLIPVVYIIIIVAGAAAYLYFKR